MKQIQISFQIILTIIAISGSTVCADVKLDDNSLIIGEWKLVGSAKDLDGPQRKGQQTWEFKKDGTLATSGYDKRLPGGNFSVSSRYEVKDGLIEADVAGRPGKKTRYSVIELTDDSLVIKQGIGQYMFFSKK